MSNRAVIKPVKIESLRDGGITQGVLVYDNYDQSYDDSWDDVPEDNMEVLRRVLEMGDFKMTAIMDNVLENKSGVCIGNNWYDWEEIEAVFESL